MSFYSPRLNTFSYVGEHRYSLTLCTLKRLPTLTEPDTARETLAQLASAADREGFAVPVYCLMPDHAHLLVNGRTSTSDLRRFIRLAKQLTEYAHRRRKKCGLWQRSVWERVLRRGEDTIVTGRYILENPMRAGLVRHPWDWPWSGSLEHSRTDIFDLAFSARTKKRCART